MKPIIRFLSIFLIFSCCITLFPAFTSARDSRTDTLPNTTSGNNDKLIALTFDDGPGKDTDRLLAALRTRGVHCTFFVVGQYAKLYPSTIRQCYEDGHQMANHSYTHPQLTSLSDSQIRSELQKTNDAVNEAVGCKLSLMLRPPYGAYNSRILSVAGVPAFYWSDDSGDWWQGATANSVYQNTIRTAGDGDILLLHDSHSWSVDAAIRIVDKLLSDGYEFVTLSELFRRRGVPLQAGQIYSWLRANGTNLPGISKPKISMEATLDGMLITMSADSGTKIYYTTDGSVPNAASKQYTEPFLLRQAATVKAVAGYDMNGSRSSRTTVSVPQLPAAQTPMITVADGKVTVTAEDTVYYTTDGSDPTAESAIYLEPFAVEPDTIIRAVAVPSQPGMIKSETVTLYFSKSGNLFDDIFPNLWYTAPVDSVVSQGLMVGTATNHFDPDAEVTRAQIVTVLCQMCGGAAEKKASRFADVPEGKWFTEAVLWAEENGIVSGYSDGSFRPNSVLSREQAAVILNAFARYCDYAADRQTSIDSYRDAALTAGYAQKAVRWAVAEGIFSGNTQAQLMPKQSLTRAQLATVVVKFKSCEANWEKLHLTDAALIKLSDELLHLLEAKDFSGLKDYVHPLLGLQFTPFSSVGNTDRVIARNALIDSAKSDEAVVWGVWDGSGEDILMTFDEYWARFVLNTDYSMADRVTPNEITVCGTSVENVKEVFEDCLFVEYAVDSCFGNDDGTDWSTLKLVFTRYEKQWYLTAIIHSEWTI